MEHTFTEKELSDTLARLGYSSSWLNYGVLTIELLIEQDQAFLTSDDENTEHYRYKTFNRYLHSKQQLTDIEFDNYLELTLSDKDLTMAGSAMKSLFTEINLTDNQFEKLCHTIRHLGKWTEKVIAAQKLKRASKTTQTNND
jgi:hypothetical protein